VSTPLNHRFGQLLDEQWHTIDAIDDLVSDLLGQWLAAADVGDHLGALPGRQAVEAEQRYLWTADPWRREVGPQGEDQQDPQNGNPIDEQVERLSRGGIAPMDVLEHHQHGLTRGQPFDLDELGAKGLLLALRRA